MKNCGVMCFDLLFSLPPFPSPLSLHASISLALSLPSLNNLLKWTDKQGQEHEIRLVDNVSAKWYEFGMILGLKLNQLDAWKTQYQGDAAICWNKVCGSRDGDNIYHYTCTLMSLLFSGYLF